jgi:hypothetical protein
LFYYHFTAADGQDFGRHAATGYQDPGCATTAVHCGQAAVVDACVGGETPLYTSPQIIEGTASTIKLRFRTAGMLHCTIRYDTNFTYAVKKNTAHVFPHLRQSSAANRLHSHKNNDNTSIIV